jgi:hypothetical protein
MPNMDVWSWTLLSGSAFIAVSVLVGLMRRRRDALLADLTSQAEEEKQRKKLADQLEKRKQRKKPKAA